ncbi:S41 family peptidase [Olivibacter sp. SDN3]|uniref:S41 family peptidase n=1 Tax=Olivibacter sp. SDN3 TaxID=2764720 RepID=UPI00165103D8|nr:S41 family peptidase [Olivibacter sp. SDN3]QNL50401.1 S41 family peptidase [Olivibacter sp. SDN3]
MSPETKKNLLTAATYAGVLFVGLLLGQSFENENARTSNTLLPTVLVDRNGKLQRLIQIVQDKYVDIVGVDTLQDYAIKEVLSNLDPHSTYMPPALAKAMGEDLNGSFDGIGVEYYRLQDTLMITSVTPGGPAQKAGVKIGDKLIGVDDRPIAGEYMKEQEVAARVRGKRGTTVNLWINRTGEDLPEPIKVTRDKIVVSSIDAAYIIDTAIAYIKIKRFGAQTANDFRDNLKRMKQYGVDKLILDLRENGGGYLRSATALASEFFKGKELLVYTQGANETRREYYSNGNGIFSEGKLVVLIDEKSASASEIVAGAVQDLDRGIVLGRRSFGKGLVQDQFDFDDGSAVNLTIARYYTPSGRCIQKSYKDGVESYFNEISRRYSSGELTRDTATNTIDTTLFRGALYHTSSGRPIYGGGGIMPDIYVPVDSLGANSFYKKVIKENIINDYVYTNLVTTPPDFSIDHYMDHYTLPRNTYSDFVELSRNRGIEVSDKETAVAQKLIEADMKALVARFFFGGEAFFRIRNEADRMLTRAIETLKR